MKLLNRTAHRVDIWYADNQALTLYPREPALLLKPAAGDIRPLVLDDALGAPDISVARVVPDAVDLERVARAVLEETPEGYLSIVTGDILDALNRGCALHREALSKIVAPDTSPGSDMGFSDLPGVQVRRLRHRWLTPRQLADDLALRDRGWQT